MVITNLIGGLGNQMFQYAAGRALSLERGQTLRLDVSGFSGYGLHQGFELQRVFNCTAEIADPSEIDRLLGWQSLPMVRRLMVRPGFACFRRDAFVVEPHFQYWRGIMDVPADSYLSGYWQSEKYFKQVAKTIRSDFSFKPPLNRANADLADQIGQVNAISLHVRRGDYAKNPKTTATHGLCPLEYYQSAIKYVTDRVENPSFYIFSDDPSWVRENMKLDFPCHYVDHNKGAESYNDMRLMSMCKHHIIANSSFSWWGAWLNPAQDKIVVAPRKWFANGNDATDLFPPEWTLL